MTDTHSAMGNPNANGRLFADDAGIVREAMESADGEIMRYALRELHGWIDDDGALCIDTEYAGGSVIYAAMSAAYKCGALAATRVLKSTMGI